MPRLCGRARLAAPSGSAETTKCASAHIRVTPVPELCIANAPAQSRESGHQGRCREPGGADGDFSFEKRWRRFDHGATMITFRLLTDEVELIFK